MTNNKQGPEFDKLAKRIGEKLSGLEDYQDIVQTAERLFYAKNWNGQKQAAVLQATLNIAAQAVTDQKPRRAFAMISWMDRALGHGNYQEFRKEWQAAHSLATPTGRLFLEQGNPYAAREIDEWNAEYKHHAYIEGEGDWEANLEFQKEVMAACYWTKTTNFESILDEIKDNKICHIVHPKNKRNYIFKNEQ
jgi:hypothetical protein